MSRQRRPATRPAQTAMSVEAGTGFSMGDSLRNRRRASNERAISRLRQEMERRVKAGADVVRIRATLHRELARNAVDSMAIDWAEHPDVDLWRDMKGWAARNGLALKLQQKESAMTGVAYVVALPSVDVVQSRLP